MGFKLQVNKKQGEVALPPYTLGQLEVNNEFWIRYLHTCFEGCLEADFIIVFAEPNRELLLIRQEVGSVEQVAEVCADDAVRVGQAGDSNHSDVCAGIDELTIGKARKVNLIVQYRQTTCGRSLLEGLNQGAVVVPTAEDNEVLLR